jgi:hypothetical protein
VKAGLIGERAQQKHVGTDLTIAELGHVHEYGGGNVPERSFIRAPYDANKERYFSGLRMLLRAVVRGQGEGRERALHHRLEHGPRHAQGRPGQHRAAAQAGDHRAEDRQGPARSGRRRCSIRGSS